MGVDMGVDMVVDMDVDTGVDTGLDMGRYVGWLTDLREGGRCAMASTVTHTASSEARVSE